VYAIGVCQPKVLLLHRWFSMSIKLGYCHDGNRLPVPNGGLLPAVSNTPFPDNQRCQMIEMTHIPLSNYPSATSNQGAYNYDCYTSLGVTAGQQFILAAQGRIATTQIGTAAYVPSWVSQSMIGTTSWPTATTVPVFHPGVNFLYPLPTTTSGSSGSGGSSGANSLDGIFSLAGLGFAASIGVLVVIAIAGLVSICCLFCLVRYFRRRKNRNQPQPSDAYMQQGQAYGAAPVQYGGPPPPGQGYAPPHGYQPPPYVLPGQMYQTKGPEAATHAV
jgi:hypothetical protein